MPNNTPLDPDDYYANYLAQTNNSSVQESTLIATKEKSSSSLKPMLLLLVLIILLAGGYYLWLASNTTLATPAPKIEITKPSTVVAPIAITETPLHKSVESISANITKPKPITKPQPIPKKTPPPTLEKALVESIKQSDSPSVKTKENKVDTFNKVLLDKTAKPTETAKKVSELIAHSETTKTAKKIEKKKEVIQEKKVVKVVAPKKETPKVPQATTPKKEEVKKIEVKQEKIKKKETDKKEKADKKKQDNYNKALKAEAKVRKEEMRYVIVKKGDSLYKIAKRVYGDSTKYKIIFKANSDILKKITDLSIGQKLRVPKLQKKKQ